MLNIRLWRFMPLYAKYTFYAVYACLKLHKTAIYDIYSTYAFYSVFPDLKII